MRAFAVGGVAWSRNNSPLNSPGRENHNNVNASVNVLQDSTNASPTPTRLRPTRPPLRPALKSRDNNAIMRVPPKAPLAAKSGNANMPSYDKQHGTNRPLVPTLSASAKTSNRTPLTPRVAASNPLTVSTPLSRRSTRQESITPASSSREDLSTPVSTFLSSNITPRSGSRKSRVDSANSTPTGTPSGTPTPASLNESFRSHEPAVYASGLGINGLDKDTPRRPTVSFSPTLSDMGHPKSTAQNTSAESKFFFASDAKTVQPAKPALQTKLSSTFVYANGESIPPPHSSGTSAVGSLVGEERAQPKFFHANGTPDLHASPSAHLPPPKPSSTISTSSRMTSPRLNIASTGALSPLQRPSSPSKLQQQASVASLRNTPSLPSPGFQRPQPLGRGQSATGIVGARRASIELSQRVASHGRSQSVGSQDIKTPIRKISGESSADSSVPGSPLNLFTISVPVSTPEELPQPEPEAEVTNEEPAAQLGSPIKTGHTLEQLNELAANARQERKVLDLEITNSSLAAINRTLEREMRKQTAELRRYRRLSRSGRLSITTSASIRSSNGVLSMDGVDGSELSDMSEEEDFDEEDFESEEDSSDESSLSPSAMAESDARHRKKDEKRLQLDLSKHQQLLIDSQKMNQSLKRCLGWTEAMIDEGKKALEYRVRVSDVELGGRVLVPDEVEEDADNEGMSSIGVQMLKEARRAAANGTAAWVGLGKDERDSGIELDGSQRDQTNLITNPPEPR